MNANLSSQIRQLKTDNEKKSVLKHCRPCSYSALVRKRKNYHDRGKNEIMKGSKLKTYKLKLNMNELKKNKLQHSNYHLKNTFSIKNKVNS